jgi:uncharacterized protein (TIGR02611 family)
VEKFKGFIHRILSFLPHPWRWLAVAILGVLVIAIGIIMLPLPGPGTLVIFLGVTILAIEFKWAKELATKGEQGIERIVRWLKETLIKPKRKK